MFDTYVMYSVFFLNLFVFKVKIEFVNCITILCDSLWHFNLTSDSLSRSCYLRILAMKMPTSYMHVTRIIIVDHGLYAPRCIANSRTPQ
jgi:hypothetical protein